MVCWWRGIWFAGQDQFDRSTAWSSTTCAGLWVVCRFLRGKTTAGVNILCAAKDRKLARERGVDGPTYRPATNCTGLWVASRSFAMQNHCQPSYFRFAKNRKLVPERGR